MTRPQQMLVFDLGGVKLALCVPEVQRVVRVVEVTPLLQALGVVSGVIDVHGLVVPVFDLRLRLGLPARAVQLSDQMIIASTATRTVALLADAVDGIVEIAEEKVTPAGEILPGLASVEGVARTGEGMIFVHDLDTLLSIDEESSLSAAIDTMGSHDPRGA